jgi:hypothetical protein
LSAHIRDSFSKGLKREKPSRIHGLFIKRHALIQAIGSDKKRHITDARRYAFMKTDYYFFLRGGNTD